MYGARVGDEIQTGPRIARKEFSRQEIAFKAIATCAGKDDVTSDVCSAVR